MMDRKLKNLIYKRYLALILSIITILFSFSSFNDFKKMSVENIKYSSVLDNNTGVQNETELFLSDNFSTHYFYNLRENFGINLHGSCGYIALGMLMTYYDTCWNESFVDDSFEQDTMLSVNEFNASVNSPGAKSESQVLEDRLYSYNEYVSEVVNINKENYLHLKLISLGMSWGLNKEENSFGISYLDLKQLTQNYLATKGLSTAMVEYRSKDDYTNSELHAYVIDKIKIGIPVMITAYGENSQAKPHVMIAYDYDINTNNIYVHDGIQTGTNLWTHVPMDDIGYTNITSAITIDPLIIHSHTNDYKYGEDTHCPCTNVNYYRTQVIFDNLNCLGATAMLRENNTIISNTKQYNINQSLINLNGIVPSVTSYGYDPQCVFLGWYADKEFTHKITQAPLNITKEYRVYAKWRIDYGWISGNRSLTVNSVQQSGNSVDQICVGTTEMLGQMAAMGIKKISVVFYIRFWEVDDGRQFVYFYKNINDDDYIKRIVFNALLENYVDKVTVTFDIEDVKNNPYIYVMYGTTDTDGADVWQSDKYHAEISYVADEAAITGTNVPPFTWYYDNSLLSRYNELRPSNY